MAKFVDLVLSHRPGSFFFFGGGLSGQARATTSDNARGNDGTDPLGAHLLMAPGPCLTQVRNSGAQGH